MNNILPEIIQYIKANYRNDLIIADIAKHFGYSTYYFSRKFKQLTGFSANEYLASLKIERSIKLIAKSGHTILSTQLKSGHHSSGTFSTTFKKHTGLSPINYKNRMSESYKKLKKLEIANSTYEVPYCDTAKSYKSSCSVEVVVPNDVSFSVIFVGLFKSPIPNHKPIVGKALFLKRSCRLKNIPSGSYYLLACGIEKNLKLINYFDLSGCYRGKISSAVSFPKNNANYIITLRKPLPEDPPILVNLLDLLRTSDKQSNL